MRKLLTLLAAAGLMIGTAAAAHADQPIIGKVCSGNQVVLPDVTANTCMEYTISDAAYVLAVVFITNNSSYTLSGHADLLALGTTVPGTWQTIQPHTANTGFDGIEVRQPPGTINDWTARGYISTGNWSITTSSK